MKKIALIIISAVLCVAIIAVCIAVYKSNTPPSDGSESVTKEQSEVTKEPGDNTKEPEDSTKEPGEVTKEPGDSTKAPDDNTKAPDESTQTPGDDTKTPGDDTKNPGSETGEPGSESGGETGTPHEHSFGEWKTVKPASCTEEGKKERTCACGVKETEILPMTAHNEVTDPAVAATCTTDGKSEGKHCSVCGKVIVAQQILAAHHTEVADPAVEATCTKTGLTAGKHCSVCGKVLVAQTTVPMKSHTYDDKNDTTCNVCGYVRDVACTHTETETVKGHDATCTAPGLTDGKKCKKCGEILTEQKTIPAKGHTEVTDAAVPATCTKTGLTEGKHCSTCGEVTVAQRTVDALPHNFDDNKAEIIISADGSSAIKRLPCKNCPTNTDLPFSGYYVSGKNAYKFDSNGKRETLEASFVDFDGNTYYVINNIIVINYFVIDGKIYDFGDDGKMINKIFDEGVITIDGNVYLVEKNNTVATGTRLVGDRFYSFGDDGKQDKTDFDHQYVTVGKDQYYVINNIIVKNYFIIDGKVIDFGSDGKKRDTVINNKIIPVGDRKYYVVNNIIIINIFVFSDGHIYRFGSDGAMLVSTKDGNYVFGADGAMNSSGKTTYVEVDDTLYEVSGSAAKKHEHKYSSETVEPTCTEDGHTTNTCDCGDSNTKKIPAKGHTEATLPAVKETCTTDGKTEGKYCSDCNKTLVEQKTIPAHHTEVVDPAVAATCETAGKTAGKHCSVCNKVLVAQTVIPAKNHNYVNGVCSNCGEKAKFSQGLKYTLNSDGKSYSVSGIGTCTDKDIIIPETYQNLSVTGIGSRAFYDHMRITSITIPSSVTSIGYAAFSGCTGLKAVYITDLAKWCGISIKSNPLYYAHDLYLNGTLVTDLIIPDGVTSISDYAFEYWAGLTSITIPDSVTNIGYAAFDGCTGLTSIVVGKGNLVYSSQGNCIIRIKYKELILGCKTSVIPNDGSVTSIANNAFAHCTELTSIIIPDSVTNINGYAFNGCIGLTSIVVNKGNTVYSSQDNCLIHIKNKRLILGCKTSVIPNDGSVTSIANNAFSHCIGLTSITIPDSITSIGDEAFFCCTNLTSIVIPGSVKSIGRSAFYACTNLISVTIGNGLESIEYGAFTWCEALTSITFKGTEKQWNEIEKDSDWAEATGNYTLIFAPEVSESQGLEFTLNSDGKSYSVSGIGTCKDTDIIIPDTYENLPVTSIGDYAFQNYTGLISITIPNSVTSIGERAFYGCTGLTSITITNGVKAIGNGAFYGCKGLTSITIPDSVTSIGDNAFQSCRGLTSITIPNGVKEIGNYTFNNCTRLTSITIPNSVKEIGNYAFAICTGLTSITIPDSVTSIGNNAFNGCTGLTSIRIPNSVTSIGIGAFWECTGLTSITIPNNVTSISGSTFSGCTGLTSITIPNSVTSIGQSTFKNCTKLETIIFKGTEEQWKKISKGSDWDKNAGKDTAKGKYTLVFDPKASEGLKYTLNSDGKSYSVSGIGTCKDTDIIIPATYKNLPVTGIGYGAFENCTRLTSITIPNSVTSIGGYAFGGCTELASINVDSKNTKYHSVNNCLIETATKTLITGCKNSKIPDDGSVTSIGGGAFYDCTDLTSITIPNSVTSIGGNVFGGCTGLTSITIPFVGGGTGDTNFFRYIFGASSYYDKTNCLPDNLKTVVVTGGSAIYEYAFKGCTGLTSITLPNSMTSIGSYAFEGCTGLISITLPNSVTSIGDGAFSGCKGLTSITLPDSVTDIGSYAFNNTAYSNNESNWVSGVLYIGNYLIKARDSISGSYTIKADTKCIAGQAFANCTKLKKVTIPDSVTSIGDGAFYGCKSLNNITIPNGVTAISDNMFSQSGLSRVVIPNSVTNIGGNVFADCYGLQIIFKGTKDQWNNINKSYNWDARTGKGGTLSSGYTLVFTQ